MLFLHLHACTACCSLSHNIKTVVEVKYIASQLGQPGSINTVEVHNSFDVEVSTIIAELYNINIKSCCGTMHRYRCVHLMMIFHQSFHLFPYHLHLHQGLLQGDQSSLLITVMGVSMW